MVSKFTPRPSDPLELAERGLEKLRDADDWDEPTAPSIHVNLPAPAPLPAVSPATSSTPSPSVLRVVLTTAQRFPPWGAVIVAVAAIAGYVALALAGKAPVP